MQACYVNTTHPDFIGGHKVNWMLPFILTLYLPTLLQATALINERLSAAKNPPPDGKNPRASVNNNKDLDVDMKKEEPSFFGSFFAPKKDAKRKGAAGMETPPSIRPQNALNERETMETEVISTLSHFTSLLQTSLLILRARTSYTLLL
jgi:dynamin 1-like protein